MAGEERDTRQGAWRRRGVLVGSAAAVVALGVGAHRLLTGSASAAAPELGPIAPGARLERWAIVAVHPVRYGGIPIVLATSQGRRYQVDVLARDEGGPPGVANTDRFSLYIANRGDGDTRTDEEQGLGAIALGRALAEYEQRAESLPELLTMHERNENYPDASFGVAL